MTKDSLILVAYVNIGNIDMADVGAYLNEVGHNLNRGCDETVTIYVIPVREQESRLECINPKLVSEEEYEKARQVCQELQDRLYSLNNENKKND